MINIKEAVIVEGKYDKQRLKGIINATIVETNGFRIFSDAEKVNLIRKLAENRGIVILTDSDSAGFVIRNHLKGILPNTIEIKHAYIPQIKGKEKRKAKPSKEGTLGVEGLNEDLLIKSLINAGVTVDNHTERKQVSKLNKADFYRLGLTGQDNSKRLRCALLKKLSLPEYITTNALADVLGRLYTFEEIENIVSEIEI